MAVLLSLLAAAAYGLADFVGGVTSKKASPWSVALVAQLGGSALVFLLSLVTDGDMTSTDVWWSVVAGVANGFGTAFLYRGLSSGRMGVVAPVSGVGAVLVPVVVGLATGERPPALVWVGIVAAIPGIWLVSREPAGGTTTDTGPSQAGSGVLDGVLAGLGFGSLFAALAQIPEEAGFLPLALNQLVAAGAIVVVAIALRQPWVPRERAAGFGVISGALGALATGAFMVAAQSGYLTVTAVLASLYPAFTVVLAATVLREHVHRSQAFGLALCAAAVGLVAGGNSPAAAEQSPGATPPPVATSGPSPTATPSPDPEPPSRVTLTVVGDIMLDRGVAAASPPGDPVWALRPLRPLLSDADLTVGNLEMALSEDGTPQQPGDDSFAGRPELLDGLAELGFDALSLANNHTGDYGETALLRTVDAVRRSDVAGFGAGRTLAAASRPAVLEVDGTRFGFVGFNSIGETPQATPTSPGALSVRMPIRTGPLDRDDLRHVEDVVRGLSAQVDAVIVLPHWGDQYVHEQLPIQSYVGRRLVAAGADLVVGGHPHVVQGVERVGDGVVAHSLGNLVFDMDFDPEAMEGVALTATFVDGTLRRVRLTPYRMDASFRPHVVAGADILADVTAHSRGRWSVLGD